MYEYLSGFCRSFYSLAKDGLFLFSRRSVPVLCGTLALLALSLMFPLPAMAQKGTTVSFLPDPGANYTIEEVASQAKKGEYQTYIPSFMAFSRLPGNFNGALWLRIMFNSSFEKPVGALRVDFGTALPGTTRLFVPQPGGTLSVMDSPPPQGIFTLPENAPFPNILYARIDGLPGLWFRPVIEAAPETTQDFPLHMALAGVFALAMLVLLIQYVRKAEEWRLWAAITAGCGIVAAVIPATPPAGMAHMPLTAVVTAMPGVIILLFAHTARHLFASPKTIPGYDRILFFYYIIGSATALLPLTPGFFWTARYLPLAFLSLVPLTPVAMVALTRSLRGSMGFFCACLLSIAGVAASAWDLTSTTTAVIDGAGGLWGFAFGMFFLAFTGPSQKTTAEAHAEDDVFDSLDRACPAPAALQRNKMEIPDFSKGTAASENREITIPSPQSPGSSTEPQTARTPERLFDNMPGAKLDQAGDAVPITAPDTAFENGKVFAPTLLEENAPQSAPQGGQSTETPPSFAKNECAPLNAPETIPVNVLKEPENKVSIVPSHPPVSLNVPVSEKIDVSAWSTDMDAHGTPAAITTIPEHELLPVEEYALLDMSSPLPFVPVAPLGHGRKSLFDLPLLVKEACYGPTQIAENKKLGISWSIAPQTGRLFEGEADLLDSALRLIVRDMVEATDKGNVRLNVRRLPDSGDAGHIVFSIAEGSTKQAPLARNMAGLAEAWSLAEKTGGIFSIEHSPAGGTTVLFSAVLVCMDKHKSTDSPSGAALAENTAPGKTTRPAVHIFNDHVDITVPADVAAPVFHNFDGDDLSDEPDTERNPMRLIVVDQAANSRARTTATFSESPYSVLECASPHAARTMYARHPSALLVMNADMPEGDIAETIKEVHTSDYRNERSLALALILVDHTLQANRMMEAGATNTLIKPVTPEELLAAVVELLPPPNTGRTPTADPAQKASLPELPAENAAHQASPKEPGNSSAAEQPATQPLVGTAKASPQRSENNTEPAPPQKQTEAVAKHVARQTPETVLDIALADIPAIIPGSPATSFEVEKNGIFSSILPVANDNEANRTESPPAPVAPANTGMGLLDMIVTDEDEDDEEIIKPPTTQGKAVVVATASPVRPVATAPKKRVSVTVTPATRRPSPAPAAEQKQPDAAPSAEGVQAPQPVRTLARAFTPPSMASETPEPTPVGSMLDGEYPADRLPQPSITQISIPLPGEEDSVFKDMLPLVPGLLHELADAMSDATRGREGKTPVIVQEAAKRVAEKASAFGLTKLERMARCVERAAAADDIEPMECVLADLENWIARYKEVLHKLHREMQW